jgi:hypothetical protein
MVGKSPSQCKNRWKTALSPSIIKITERRKWVPEEDEKLSKLVKKYGTKNWRIIASHLRGRLPKQCRERWINHLDPIIVKGRLTEKEWKVVLDSHEEMGNRWSEIAKLLPGRTPNQIKNHWHAMLRKTNKRKQREYSLDGDSMENNSMSNEFGEGDINSNDEIFIPQSLPSSSPTTCTVNDAPIVDEELLRPRKKFKINKENNRPCSKLEALVQIAEFMYQYEVNSPSSTFKSSPSTLLSFLNPSNSQTSTRMQRNGLDNLSQKKFTTESIISKEISIREKKYHGEVKEFSPLPVSQGNQSIQIQGLVKGLSNLIAASNSTSKIPSLRLSNPHHQTNTLNSAFDRFGFGNNPSKGRTNINQNFVIGRNIPFDRLYN